MTSRGRCLRISGPIMDITKLARLTQGGRDRPSRPIPRCLIVTRLPPQARHRPCDGIFVVG